MIQVKKPPVDGQDWRALVAQEAMDNEWADVLARADAARKTLIQEFDKDQDLTINAALYKRYMDFLIKLFNGKCAYCEVKITLSQPGDVEHFRPKGRVVDENFKPIRVRHPIKNKEMDHPGYYWLAYEWRNLLPSCIDCNRYRKHGEPATPVVNKSDAGQARPIAFPSRTKAGALYCQTMK